MGSPMESADEENEEPVFNFNSAFSSQPPAHTFRVSIRHMNFTKHWIQPIHEGVAAYLQKAPIVAWKGRCTVKPWSNVALCTVSGYKGEKMFAGQVESDSDGGLKVASLVRSPLRRLIMVLVVDVENWGEKKDVRVLVVDQDTDFQSAEFEKKCDEAGKLVKFDCTLQEEKLKFQLEGDIHTTKWPPFVLFQLHEIMGDDEIPVKGSVDLYAGMSDEALEKMMKKYGI